MMASETSLEDAGSVRRKTGLVTAPDCHSVAWLPSTARAAAKVPLVWLAVA
ncbi:hypothetical protein D3C78_1936290 [compost metagenome]